jgi:hypothetical protein
MDSKQGHILREQYRKMRRRMYTVIGIRVLELSETVDLPVVYIRPDTQLTAHSFLVTEISSVDGQISSDLPSNKYFEERRFKSIRYRN